MTGSATTASDLLAQSRSPLDLGLPASSELFGKSFSQNPLEIPAITSRSSTSALDINPLSPAPFSAFNSGYFTVGNTGQVSVDYLFDGGGYEGELGIFSLSGLEQFDPGSNAFIQEVVRRILSGSTLGHRVIDDHAAAARFTGSASWEGNFNAGDYLGVTTVAMNPGDTFGVALLPHGSFQQIVDRSDLYGSMRPLFSLATANPNQGFQFGQIADVTGNGSTFALEDLRVDGYSDRDYNDMIFQVRGAIGSAVSLDDVIPLDKDWRESMLGQGLLEYAAAYDNPRLPNPIRYEFPPANQPLIGIIDTGFAASNPDIDYSRITLGRDRVDNDADPLLAAGTGNEHGTHVIGIIGATQDNGIGIDGINNQAPLWVGRAIGSGKWAESLTEFVDKARQDGQPNAVVNLSLDLTQKNPDGSTSTRYEFTPAERKAIEYARQNSVLIVAAAGNDAGVMSVLGQASQEFDNIITVGAANGGDRADYSSYGAGLDILAPGGVTSDPVISTVGQGVGEMKGTSVATAEVTGAISQVWAANPGLNYRQVIDLVKLTATDLKTPGWDAETGAGLLNLERAVELALQTLPETYQPTGWIEPKTWQGAGTLPPEERAAQGGTSRDQASFMPAAFSDSDTLSATVPKRYYKVVVDKPGYYEWTVTRTNGTAFVPAAGLVDGNGKRAGHRFVPGGGAIGSIESYVGEPTSKTSGVFVDPGIYYLEVGSSVGSSASYKVDTKWSPDGATIAAAGNAVFNPQPRISDRRDQYQPFATGTTNSLNASGTVTYKFGDDGKQYANYSFEVSEPGQLSFNLNSPNGRSVVNVKKFVGQSNQAVIVGGREFSPTSTGNSVLNLSQGRYEVEVTVPFADIHTDPDGRAAFLQSQAQNDLSLFVVNRPYTLNATFARTAPKPGEGKVPSSAGVLTETVSSNGVTTHYYANGYLTIQPSGVATWYSKGLWTTVSPVNPVGQTSPVTPTVISTVPAIPTPTPTPILLVDPDGDETMAKARSLVGAQAAISATVSTGNSNSSQQPSQGGSQPITSGKKSGVQKGKIGGISDLNDWYKFTLTEPRWVKLSLNGSSLGNHLLLWDSQDGSTSGNESNGYTKLSRVLSPGTYYVQIDNYSNQETKYNLNYSLNELEGLIFRGNSNQAYVIENGKRWSVPSTEVGRSLSRNWDTIEQIPQDDLDQIPLGGIYKPVWQRQIESKYGSTAGMLGSSLGSIAVAGKSPDGTTGYFQRFNTGAIHWSAKHGAVAVWHDIQRVYEQNGGTGGKLGFPTKQEHDWEGGKRTDFEGGFIFFTDRLGAQVFYNGETPWQKEIANEYGITQNLLGNYGGGPSPTGTSFNGTKGYWSSYDKGTIHWSAQYGAVAVWQELQQVYNNTGGSGGWLGFPTQREQDWETGKRTEFEGGFIFWTPQTGARAYHFGEEAKALNDARPNHAPQISVPGTFNTLYGTSFKLEDYIQVSDPDGDSIQRYELQFDPDRVDVQATVYQGSPQGDYVVPGDQLGSIQFFGSVLGTNPVNIRAYDGKDWSGWQTFNLNVLNNSSNGSGGGSGSSNINTPLGGNPTEAEPLRGFRHPLGNPKIQSSQENNEGSHVGRSAYAIDFPVNIGSPVYAMRQGKVVAVRDIYPDTGGGADKANAFNYVLVEHENGYRSAYIHLQQGSNSRVGLQVGDSVKAGQLIGYSGNSGWSTGPHLHVEVHRANGASLGQTVPFNIDTLGALGTVTPTITPVVTNDPRVVGIRRLGADTAFLTSLKDAAMGSYPQVSLPDSDLLNKKITDTIEDWQQQISYADYLKLKVKVRYQENITKTLSDVDTRILGSINTLRANASNAIADQILSEHYQAENQFESWKKSEKDKFWSLPNLGYYTIDSLRETGKLLGSAAMFNLKATPAYVRLVALSRGIPASKAEDHWERISREATREDLKIASDLAQFLFNQMDSIREKVEKGDLNGIIPELLKMGSDILSVIGHNKGSKAVGSVSDAYKIIDKNQEVVRIVSLKNQLKSIGVLDSNDEVFLDAAGLGASWDVVAATASLVLNVVQMFGIDNIWVSYIEDIIKVADTFKEALAQSFNPFAGGVRTGYNILQVLSDQHYQRHKAFNDYIEAASTEFGKW